MVDTLSAILFPFIAERFIHIIEQAIATLEKLGATLEGQVREPSFGKVAAIRRPDGHLVSLLQPSAISATTQEQL